MPSRRQRKLDVIVAGLQLQYGPRAVRRAVGRPVEPVPCIATTFSELDAALAPHGQRGGGLPRGRISEIIGPATSGKVTLAAKVLAAAQQERDAIVAWLDLGRTCDPDYLDRCGLDLDWSLIVYPRDDADALAIALHLVESNALAVLVFDGLSDLLPKNQTVALATGILERMSTVVAQTRTVVLFLTEPYAQSRTLAHMATVRLAIRREHWITRDGDVRGYEGTVEILKHNLRRDSAPDGAPASKTLSTAVPSVRTATRLRSGGCPSTGSPLSSVSRLDAALLRLVPWAALLSNLLRHSRQFLEQQPGFPDVGCL